MAREDGFFDELARRLAEGSISRRRALRLFAGSAIAALIPSTRAMAASTSCPSGTVKICHVPQRADGTCRRRAAKTLCVTPAQAATHADHPCDCCGGCGGTDNCREPKPRTCFSTSTTSTSTTPACLPNGATCPAASGEPCCSGNCKGGTCAESCIPPNASPCDPSNPESCGGAPCFCERATEGGGYCQTDGSSTFCSSSCDCPAGQFCQATGDGGRCAIAGTCGA